MTLNCITTKPIEVTRMSKKENVNYFLHCPISQLSIENNLTTQYSSTKNELKFKHNNDFRGG